MLRRKARARRRAVGSAPREPRPQGAPRHPRDVPARRAVPDLGGRALRDGDGHPPSRRAAARAAVRPPRRVRPLLLVPRLPAARALRHREPAAHPGDPPGGVRRDERRLQRRASPSRCWRASTSSSTPSRARFRSTTSPRSRRGSRRRRAPGRTTSATRSPSRSARSAPARSSSATARRSPAPTARTSPPGRRCPTSSGSSGSTPTATSAMSLYVPLESTLDHLAFKLVRSGKPILLSDVLPLLENMGVRVSDERPVRDQAAPTGRRSGSTTSGSATTQGAEFQADDVREMFQDAFARAWRGESENDGFNRLVLSARLTAREITILRAIAKYLRQAGSTFSQAYMEDALSAHPDVARGLVELFRIRLDPAQARRRGRAGADARAGAGERRSTRSRASTRTGSCAASCASSAPCCARTTSRRTPPARRSRTSRSSSIPTWFPTCPSRGRCSRSSSTRRASRPSTCAAAGSRAAASAGPTGARTSAPRCSG